MQAKRKLNIVYWAFPSWNGDYMKSTVELAKELAVKHRVLYIDYAYTLKDVLTAKSKPFMPVKRITGQAESLQEVKLENGGTIYVLSLPPIIPFNWAGNKTIYEILEGLNSTIVAGRVKRALKKIDFDTDVVVNAFNPFFGKATKKVFAGKPVLYYCYDNIDAAAWAAKHGARLEKDFMCSVDGVIFSSDALLENKASRAPKFVVKNGVDLRAFGEIKPTTSPGKNKVIGYTGTVDDRLDFELLENMIKAKPGFEFRFIGRVITPKAEALKKYSNVKFYGPVEPPTLPAMMKDFDAGIIPFLKNDFTRNIYPMKANEYLALGIPVVATAFANLKDLDGFIETADTTEAFFSAIEKAIDTDSPQLKEQRKLKARTNSWEQKATEFENILMQYAA